MRHLHNSLSPSPSDMETATARLSHLAIETSVVSPLNNGTATTSSLLKTPSPPSSPTTAVATPATRQCLDSVASDAPYPQHEEKSTLFSLLKKFMNQDVDSLRVSVPLAIIEPISNLEYLAQLEQVEHFVNVIRDPPFSSPSQGNRHSYMSTTSCSSMTSRLSRASKSSYPEGPESGATLVVDLSPNGYSESLADIKRRDCANRLAELSRFVGVLRVAFSTLKRGLVRMKKPLNPILGETYECAFRSRTRSAQMPEVKIVGEQVSHHPPISAYHMTCHELGIQCTLVYDVKAKFTGTNFLLQSHSYCRFVLSDEEEYRITFPNAYASGVSSLLFKLMWTGAFTVSCKKTGLSAELKFKEKKWWLAKETYDISGKVVRRRADGEYDEGTTVAWMNGKWDDHVRIKFSGEDEGRILWSVRDADDYAKHPGPIVTPRETFSPNVWEDIIRAMNDGDTSAASRAKHHVEHRERLKEKERKAKGEKWVPRYFYKAKDGSWRWRTT